MKKYTERVSIRDFDKKPLSEKDLKTLINVINNSPTSTNSQQFSAIIITDQELKKWIAKMNWGQKHIEDSAAFILFVGDRTRILEATGKESIDEDIKTHEFMRATIDATIASTYAHDALIQMGYGTTFVGGVLAFADELSEKLNLPKSAFPIVGLSFGKATRANEFKPKINKVYLNKYNKDEVIKETHEYDVELKKYYQKRNPNSRGDFMNTNKSIYDINGVYGKAFKKAGILIKKNLNEFK